MDNEWRTNRLRCLRTGSRYSVSLAALSRIVSDAGAMRDTARSSGNQQFDRQGANVTAPPTVALPSSFGLSPPSLTPFDDTDLPPIRNNLSSSRNQRVSPNGRETPTIHLEKEGEKENEEMKGKESSLHYDNGNYDEKTEIDFSYNRNWRIFARCMKNVTLDAENYDIPWSLCSSTADLHANCYVQNEYAALFKGFHFEHLRASNTSKRLSEIPTFIKEALQFALYIFCLNICIHSRIRRTGRFGFPVCVSRGRHFTTFGGAINRRAWSDLCIDIGALKYTNVPLIGLSPPVRTIKAALHAVPKSLLTATPFKCNDRSTNSYGFFRGTQSNRQMQLAERNHRFLYSTSIGDTADLSASPQARGRDKRKIDNVFHRNRKLLTVGLVNKANGITTQAINTTIFGFKAHQIGPVVDRLPFQFCFKGYEDNKHDSSIDVGSCKSLAFQNN
ncbi:hypothetical protein EAG_03589 [Camponotus floridanus]|uniref:Uncharacterized protein n=1 Tax=Camponotus floridanus TaxID=104421 RepID=E2ANY7_CAMFO|nr:hypothetical protein EAG_03589 [Camponotus floridanus]